MKKEIKKKAESSDSEYSSPIKHKNTSDVDEKVKYLSILKMKKILKNKIIINFHECGSISLGYIDSI